MTGLSSDLYTRCRSIFLKCSQFDSNASLRAVFAVAELRPFQDGLPGASSKGERVDACLAFLVDKHLSDGRAVLPLFITALRDRYQGGDVLRDELEALRLEAQQELDSPTRPSKIKDSDSAEARSKTYSPNLQALIEIVASYGPIEFADLAESLGMRAPLSPRDRRGASREIVISLHQQGRLDELILRLQIDGKL